jgi:DNA-binding LacI/PurR family transcriptional regulator
MTSSQKRRVAKSSGPGRVANGLAAMLRREIAEGRMPAGEFLPSERELAAEHGLAVMTVRRALQALQSEGLVKVQPRRGCRVLPAANDPLRGCPVAYIHARPPDEVLDQVSKQINLTVQESVGRRGWSTLVVHLGDRAPSEVVEQLRAARVWGVILEAVDPELLGLLKATGMPVLMVNAWTESAEFDAVLQDNYQGGFLAAQHLIDRGHTEIGWLGHVASSNFSRERIGGALAALTSAGLEMPAELRSDTSIGDPDAAAVDLLSRTPRPRAVLALWTDVAVALAGAARKLGLQPGRDLDMVGWAIEERYHSYGGLFPGGKMPAMITWKVADLGRAAAARLSERRADPELPYMRINVATRLRAGE